LTRPAIFSKNEPSLDNPPRDVGFQTVTLNKDLSRDKFFEVLRHPEVRALARLEGWPQALPVAILRGSPKAARTSG
jgi:hypothetical protein